MTAPPTPARPGQDDPRAGFVLSLVVFLLFAIGIAGAASYQVVLNEAALGLNALETQRALSVARAGLQRYMATEVGVHEDTVTYAIEEGDAVVTARLVASIDDYQTLYALRSEGVYINPASRGAEARRVVYQYAIKQETALTHAAALTQASGSVRLHNPTETYGVDQAAAGDCAQSQTNIRGVLMGSGSLTIDGFADVNGTAVSLTVGSMAAVLDTLGLDWSLLTSSSFPVDYAGTWPSCGLPADSFTVTRFTGDVTGASGACGRGVLIVKGALNVQPNFTWEGVILAGYFNAPNDDFHVDGLVVSGLDGLGAYTDVRQDGYIHYNRCYAFQAGRRLSHFRPVGSTWWERM